MIGSVGQQDLQSPLASGPAPRVTPPTVSEAFAAAREEGERLNAMAAEYRNQRDYIQQRLDTFQGKTGIRIEPQKQSDDPAITPDEVDGAYRAWVKYARAATEAEAKKRNDPSLALGTDEDIARGGLNLARGAATRAAESQRAGGFAGSLGRIGAGAVDMATDPYNLAGVALTLPVGGEGGLLVGALRAGGGMAGQQLIGDVARYGYRKQVDPTYGVGDVALDVAQAGAAGALFGGGHALGGQGLRAIFGAAAGGALGGGAIGGLAGGLPGAFEGAVGGAGLPLAGAGVHLSLRSVGMSWRALKARSPEIADNLPLDVRDEGEVAEKVGDLHAQNPFTGPSGDAAHGEAVHAAEEAINKGQPFVLPEAATAEAAVRRGQIHFPGGSIDARYALAEHSDLVTSHDADFNIRPDYPSELQPRDRSSAPAQDQVNSIAARLEPDRLGPSPEANAGAPIVGPDRVVESGNGRVLAIGKAYDAGRGEAYRTWLERQGYDTTGYDKPVLVALRETPLEPAQRAGFAHAANGSASLRMSAAEQALSDARHLASSVIDLAKTPELSAAANREFARAFVAKLPEGERGGMLTREGNLSANGVRRAQAALAARAYGDQTLLSRAFDHPDPNIKAIAGALTDAGAPWARMRDAATRGDIEAGHDITRDVLQAVHAIMRARDEGVPTWEVLNQRDIFQSDTTQLATRMFFRDGAMRQPAGRKRVAENLTSYAEEAAKNTTAGRLFDDAIGPLDVLRRMAEKALPEPEVEPLFASLRRARERVAADLDTASQDAAATSGSAPENDALASIRETATRLNGWKTSSPFRSIDDMLAASPANQERLATAGTAISREIGVTFKNPGPKTDESARRKFEVKQYEKPGEMTDLVRGGFITVTPEQAERVVAALRQRFDILDEGWNTSPSGYVDRKVLIRFADGQIGEVQLWEPHMLEAKEQGGHAIYAERRQLTGDDPRRPALMQRERQLYADALSRTGADWKAVLGNDGSDGNVLSKVSRDNTLAELPTSSASTRDQAPFTNAQDSPSRYSAGRPSQEQNFSSSIERLSPKPNVGAEPAAGNEAPAPSRAFTLASRMFNAHGDVAKIQRELSLIHPGLSDDQMRAVIAYAEHGTLPEGSAVLYNKTTHEPVVVHDTSSLKEMLGRFDVSRQPTADMLLRASSLAIGNRLGKLVGDIRVFVVDRDEMRRLAAGRLKLVEGMEPGGFFDSKAGQIIVLRDAMNNPREAMPLLLHEGLHAAFMKVIDGSQSARNVIDHLRAVAAAAHMERGGSLDEHYGLGAGRSELHGETDVRRAAHEFVSEGLSNPEFQRFLASIPADERIVQAFGLDKAPGYSLWDVFVGAVRKILGLKPEEHTLLDATLRLGDLLEQRRTEMVRGEGDELAAMLRPIEDSITPLTAEEEASRDRALSNVKDRIAYRINADRIAQHPKGPLAGFLGILTRDIHEKGGINVESVQADYEGRMAEATEKILEPYGSKWAGLKQDVVGIRDVISEVFGVDTKNTTAKAAAEAWTAGVDGFAVAEAKRLGKAFTPAEDWRLPQFWESARAQKFGKAVLLADMEREITAGGLEVFDPDTHAPASALRMRDILDGAADKIVTDASLGTTHGTTTGAFTTDMRVFRFTQGKAGADAYLRLMDKYGAGRGGYLAMMQAHVGKVSRELGLTRVLGPGWAEVGERLLNDTLLADRRAKANQPPRDLSQRIKDLPQDAGRLLTGWLESPQKAQAVWQHMSGQASGVGSELMAGLLTGARAFMVSSRMGSALVTAIPTDSVNWLMAAKHNGMDMGRMVSEVTKAFLKDSPERREEAARLGISAHAAIDAAIGTKRFEDQFVGEKLMTRMADFVVRAQGLHAWDSAVKRAFVQEFLGTIGQRAGKAFDQLDEPFANFIDRYGLKDEWGELSRPDRLIEVGDAKYLHPDQLPDATRIKLMSAIYDERQFAYLGGGSERVSAISGQAKAGTLPGELARSAMLFKSFSLKLLGTWGMRAAREAGQGKVATLATLITGLTFAGALAMQARAMVMGKNPRSMKDPFFWGEAFFQGGAAGIYGDFFKEAFSRSDTSLTETLLGPLAAIPAGVQGLTSGARRLAEDGEKVNFGAKLARLISQNTPGGNLWYSRLLASRLVFDNVQRMLDRDHAKSFARQQQRALKRDHQGFFWAPGASGPSRAPDFGASVL